MYSNRISSPHTEHPAACLKSNKHPVFFVLALHNHQPVGNLQDVFESSFRDAYAPFVDLLYSYPSIKAVLHYSGVLLEWIEKNHPSFLAALRKMVQRGQIEMLGGGYYEPIFPLIPDSDKRGQILKLSRYLRQKIGAVAEGLWLTERVYEPHLVLPLSQAGMRYAVVNYNHFELGINKEELKGYFLTEEQGFPLNLFPINGKLRDLIPFQEAEKTIEYFETLSEKTGNLAVLIDNGEKYGSWPGTKLHVHDQGWLEQFFHLLHENRDWIKTTTFSQYLSQYPPRGRVYLPSSTCREMDRREGGFQRNLLIRYPESNRMHKKMLAVRRRLHTVTNRKRREKARDYIWAAQCNCAYRHSEFGGVSLNFLRSAVYSNLIRAENIIVREHHHHNNWLEFRVEDRDFDGQRELILNNECFSLLLSPSLGGSLWELSYRPAAVNLLDTLTRSSPELYQRGMLPGDKDGEGEEKLLYDPYPRGGLLDHFLFPEADLELFSRGEFTEVGDFLLKPYRYRLKYEKGKAQVIFTRRGSAGNRGNYICLKKTVSLEGSSHSIGIQYNLSSGGCKIGPFKFGVELNFSLLAGYAPDRYFYLPGRELELPHLAGKGEEANVGEVHIIDEWRQLRVTLLFTPRAGLWRFPVETLSRSERGIEKVYQQSVLFPFWDLNLRSGEQQSFSMELSVKTLDS